MSRKKELEENQKGTKGVSYSNDLCFGNWHYGKPQEEDKKEIIKNERV
jgi:hypothetical protein